MIVNTGWRGEKEKTKTTMDLDLFPSIFRDLGRLMFAPRGPCGYCGVIAGLQPSSLQCRGCLTMYCCMKHCKKDWKTHRTICSPYKVVLNPKKPSKLQATEKICAGKIFLKSKAIAVGPNGVKSVCLGCLSPLIYDVMSYQCSGCGWPVCNEDCEKAAMHKLECNAMQEAGYHLTTEDLHGDWDLKFPSTPGPWLLVLRVLLLNEKLKLQADFNSDGDFLNWQYNIHYQVPKISSYLKSGVKFIKETLKIQKFKSAEICSVGKAVIKSMFPIDFGSNDGGPFEPCYAFGVFSSDLIFLQHSCHPNMEVLSDEDDVTSIRLRALRDIDLGEILTVNRRDDSSHSSTWRRHLSMSKLSQRFCECLRCRSPSELNFHFGSLSCECRGMVLPKSAANILKTDWSCESCGRIIEAEQYCLLLNECADKLQLAGDSLEELHKFIDAQTSPSGLLHENHDLIFEAKTTFIKSIYTRSSEKGAAYDFPFETFERLKEYATAVINHLSGFNSIRAFQQFILFRILYSRYYMCQWAQGKVNKSVAEMHIDGNCMLIMQRESALIRGGVMSREVDHAVKQALLENLSNVERLNSQLLAH